jgi:hypothetical protein
MQDITEGLRDNEKAVEMLGGSINGRLLRFELMDEPGTESKTSKSYEYYQDTLGMLPVQDLFNKFKRQVQSFIDQETGVKIGELFRGETDLQAMTDSLKSASEEQKADKLDDTVEENRAIIEAIFKLMDIVPEFQLDIYALTLGVPRRRAEWFKDAISEPPYRGGLTIEQGFDLLRVFVRQNTSAIKRFFTEEAQSLVQEMSLILDEIKEDQAEDGLSTGGKPSSTSAPATPASA